MAPDYNQSTHNHFIFNYSCNLEGEKWAICSKELSHFMPQIAVIIIMLPEIMLSELTSNKRQLEKLIRKYYLDIYLDD